MKIHEIYPIVKAAAGGDDDAAEHLADLLASGEIDPHKVVPLLVAAARQDEEEAEAADLMAEVQASLAAERLADLLDDVHQTEVEAQDTPGERYGSGNGSQYERMAP